MSYSNPRTMRYDFGIVDFAAGGGPYVFHVQGPAGAAGILRNVSVDVDEVFATSTLAAKVEVGDGSDADEFASLTIPDETADETVFDIRDDTDAIIDAKIPANTVVTVTCTEGTDASSVTGQGYVSIEIDWM